MEPISRAHCQISNLAYPLPISVVLIGLLFTSPSSLVASYSTKVVSTLARSTTSTSTKSSLSTIFYHTKQIFNKNILLARRAVDNSFSVRNNCSAKMMTRTASSSITVSSSSSQSKPTPSSSNNDSIVKYIDAGTNLLDSMYSGVYHSKTYHDADLNLVLQRAYMNGIDKVICLAGTIDESQRLLDFIDSLHCETMTTEPGIGDTDSPFPKNQIQLYGTVGVHPTRTAEVFANKIQLSSDDGNAESFRWSPKSQEEQNEIIHQMIQMVHANNDKAKSSSSSSSYGSKHKNIVAIGECGLDYARLEYSPKEIQLIGLRCQLLVARATGLPLYLHNRESGQELYEILFEYANELVGNHREEEEEEDDDDEAITHGKQPNEALLRGIVHSFDENIDIANKFLSLGLYIGINGCSLKTFENLQVVQNIPLNRIILETDCPWCDIRPTHASYQHLQTFFPTLKEKQYNKESQKEKYCVKNRTEPCHVVQVAEVVAALHGTDVLNVAMICRQNALDLFGIMENH